MSANVAARCSSSASACAAIGPGGDRAADGRIQREQHRIRLEPCSADAGFIEFLHVLAVIAGVDVSIQMPRRSAATRIAGNRWSTVEEPSTASRTGLVVRPGGALGSTLARRRSSRMVSRVPSLKLASATSDCHAASAPAGHGAASASAHDGAAGSQ